MKEETLDGFCEHCLRPVTVTVKAAILSLPSLHKSGTCFEHPCTSQKAAVLHLPPFRGVLPGHWALNWRVHFYQKPTKHKETRNVIFYSELPDGQRQSKGSTAPCSPSPASLKELKLIISATTQGNSKKTFDQLFSHYSSHSPRMYTLQLKYMGLILLMILNMCINALLNWSQLKQKRPCADEKEMCISWTQNLVIWNQNHTWEYCRDFWPNILNTSVSEDLN